MASLKNYVYGLATGAALTPGEFVVWNTSTTSAGNGGCCYLWTVPAGVTRAVFEVWSGGGSGAGGCCCMQGGGAGSGGYTIKACSVTAGQQIQICAAGSGCCGDYYTSISGCPSWICALTGTTWCLCVPGGVTNARCVTCYYGCGCYTCCASCYCCGGISNNANFFSPGTSSTGHASQYCFDQYHQYASNAYGVPGPRIGPNGCCSEGGSCGFGIFPGGGGHSAQSHSGQCCCGGPGAGGMVYVIYY